MAGGKLENTHGPYGHTSLVEVIQAILVGHSPVPPSHPLKSETNFSFHTMSYVFKEQRLTVLFKDQRVTDHILKLCLINASGVVVIIFSLLSD